MYEYIDGKNSYFIANELVTYYKHSEEERAKHETVKITSSRDVAVYLRPFFEVNNHRENFVAVYLDRKNVVIGCSVISSGDVAGTVVNMRTIFAPAIQGNASALVIAHNHPSGNRSPSVADHCITKEAKAAGEALNIELIDSIIWTSSSYYSMRDEGDF